MNQMIKRSFSGNRAVIRGTLRSLGRLVRQTSSRIKKGAVPDEASADLEMQSDWLNGEIARLTEELKRNLDYLGSLQETFEISLKETRQEAQDKKKRA